MDTAARWCAFVVDGGERMSNKDYRILQNAANVAINLVNINNDLVKLPDDLVSAAAEAASAIQHLLHVLREVSA